MSTIYGIYSNNEIKKYDSVQSAIKAGALFSCIANTKRIESNNQSNVYEYEFQFYDNSSSNINLTYGNWKLNSRKILFKLNLNRLEKIKINVIDKFGQIDFIELSGYQESEILKNMNESLKEMSSFNSWDEYKLKQENLFLKSELEKLKNNPGK